MSMAAPFLPEPAHDEADTSPEVPQDDLLVDADTADGAPVDEAPHDDTVPDDDVLEAPDAPADDDEVADALASEGPQGLRLPEAGGGLTSDELREDLAE